MQAPRLFPTQLLQDQHMDKVSSGLVLVLFPSIPGFQHSLPRKYLVFQLMDQENGDDGVTVLRFDVFYQEG